MLLEEGTALDSVRDKVLEAVEQGQISAREAARLLDALAGRREGRGGDTRLRVVDLSSGRALVDVSLTRAALEAMARVGVYLDQLWGLGRSVAASAVLEALDADGRGLLAAAEANGRRLEVLAERD
jgi:hypothetical protein